MKRKKLILLTVISIVVISSVGISGCRPRDEDDAITDSILSPADLAIASAVFSPIGSPVASPVATLYLHPDLLRIRFEWVYPGWFPLGSDPDEDSLSRGDETPQTGTHQPGFWMSQGEVTNKEYALCVEAGVCSVPSLRPTGPTNHFGNPAYDDHPVVGVSWFQAEGYCEWINGRLPTEAEWEKAAGGAVGSIYPWGDESPTCDRANGILDGCETIGDTQPVGSYPLGISSYGLFDMAGNVREWTFDWYAADAYLNVGQYAPAGPAEGEKKVVRGGGFNDFKENLRTTARWAYEPARDFDDVGFRCIPLTKRYPTFCEPSYVPLCYDPDIPAREEPCVPGQNVPGEEGVTLLGFGCPMNKTVCFEVDTNGGGTAGYTATVDADGFTCRALDERPDILQCCGPEQPMGRNVSITVCAPGGSPDGEIIGTSALDEEDGIKLASLVSDGVLTLMRTTAPNCPDGYIYDAASGACVPDPTQPACPDGTQYSERLKGCVPADEDCPKGYLLSPAGLCEPDEATDPCLPGYYFNTAINCCAPIELDNYGCEDGYYWNARYEKCVPIDAYNCPFGTTYNGYGECVQDPLTPAPDDPAYGECPPGMTVAAANSCDPAGGVPPDDDMPRPGDATTPNGEVILATTGLNGAPCAEGYYYDAKFEACVQRDANGCPSGYFFDTGLAQCVPTNGPTSPCPIGFVYNARTECCTPEPGMDSTRCPEDEQLTPGTIDLTQGMTPFAASNFDPNSGACSNDGQNGGGTNECPPTTFAAAVGTCDQYPEDGETVPPDPCKETEYFDRLLGYCVPLMPDCCPIGQDYAAAFGGCVDVATKPRDGECPEGFELIDGLCWLLGRTEGQGGMCWTITRNTPQCIGPCEVGLIYNEVTGRCEEPVQPEDPCADVNCAGYGTNDKGCNADSCCKWVPSATHAGTCVKR